jgi:hypothetical protein
MIRIIIQLKEEDFKKSELLHNALVNAFENLQAWEMLMSYELGKELNKIVTQPKNLDDIALQVIAKAKSEGWVEALMDGALCRNRGNQKLQFAYAAITLTKILELLENNYTEQIKYSFAECCSDNSYRQNEKNPNQNSIAEEIFVFFKRKQNDSLILWKVIDLAAHFLIKVQKSTCNDSDIASKICEKLKDKFTFFLDKCFNEKFSDYLQKIEDKWRQSSYYKALLGLNFSKQLDSFQQIVGQNSVGACIIHGQQGSGQRWLLHRLIEEIPNQSDTPPKFAKIALQKKGFAPTKDNILAEISRHFIETKGPKEPKEIIDAIYNCWINQNVIIIFYEVDRIPEKQIQDSIYTLWIELVNKVQNSDIQTHSCKKLFMFLIDENGCVEKWIIEFREPDDNNLWTDFAIKLLFIDKLSPHDLKYWIQEHKKVLPDSLTKLEEPSIKELLIQWDGGLAMKVIYEICRQCDNSLWEDIDKRCLQY